MRFDVVTLFPGFFEGPLQFGVLERALRQGRAAVHLHDLREFTHDRHRTVDDRPFGGGEGMVMKPEPLFECVEALGLPARGQRDGQREAVCLLSAAGERFTQGTARHLASLDRLVLLCGRYEGVDQRVADLLCDQELSVGDFVLSGGELGAALIIDAVVRLLPGVLGHADSSRFESFADAEGAGDPGLQRGVPQSTHNSGGLLDYPQYTRPAVFRGVAVPEALAGGDHAAIREWRRRAALERTLRHRPDLLQGATLSPADQATLGELRELPSARRS